MIRRDDAKPRELSAAELDGVRGAQGVLFGLMQKVRDEALTRDPGEPRPVAVPYPNST